MKLLETERLILRQWEVSDFEIFENYFSNEENARYVGGVKTREEAWRLMATYVGHWHLKGYSYLAVVRKDNQEVVGCVGLWNSDPWPEMELGYWFLSEHQGKGFASEAAKFMLEFAFNELKVTTLVSYIDPENMPSRKLAERLGGVNEETIELLGFGAHYVYRYARSNH